MAEKATASTAVPGEGAHLKAVPPLDATTFAPQLFWLALTFGLLYVLLKRFALPRVGEILQERQARIQRDLDKAEALKTETQQALAGYEQALSDARSRAQTMAADVRGKLMQEVDGERAKIDAEIARQTADAEERIRGSKDKALTSVNDIAAETAGAIVAKLLGTDVGRDEIQSALSRPAK
jgi:F-type H+-transporting ATPase subunit b